MEQKWRPLPSETPEEYVERVGGWDQANVHAILAIESNFGLDRGESRVLFLNSRSFWENFFFEHIKGIFNRGGSRYGALRYLQRKNKTLKNGNKMFSKNEIDAFVDSIGNWER